MRYFLITIMAWVLSCELAYSQVELAPWGNVIGIRKQGQLLPFETSLQLIKSDGWQILTTAPERQRPQYTRTGNAQVVTTSLDSLLFKQTITDLEQEQARVDVQLTSRMDTTLTGIYFLVRIPAANGTLNINGQPLKPSFVTTKPVKGMPGIAAKGFNYRSKNLDLSVQSAHTDSLVIRKDEKSADWLVYFPIKLGQVKKGDVVEQSFIIQASGSIDKSPVNVTVNAAAQGRPFDGIGGNFRLQNPATDPQVIDYCLNNMRVAWGRVELPWRLWQPDRDENPLDAAGNGKLAEKVTQSLEMAQRLGKMGIPVILSAWSAPDWAITGPYHDVGAVNGVWGNALNKNLINEIYRSLTRYILFLKEHYGVEVKLFSFNESDLGINVRMTADEHVEFIRGMGQYMKSKGLNTQLLLGDNADATSYKFIEPALHMPDIKPYIGAVAFHSWRGWDTPTLKKWDTAANILSLPLLITEGSIDAAAWQYPAIFEEPSYALNEIALYLRLLANCQPAAILQWQLTADYSPLAGGGIFGNNTPLHPTQRFWNLKQLAATPARLFSLPVVSSTADVVCAALGNSTKGQYVLHLVNRGAERLIKINGLPKGTQKFKLYITSQQQANQMSGIKKASNGTLQIKLPQGSFISLISE